MKNTKFFIIKMIKEQIWYFPQFMISGEIYTEDSYSELTVLTAAKTLSEI